MKKHLQYKYQDSLIDYFVIEKNIKNLWMKINSKNEIIIVVPINANKAKINEFIESNITKFALYIEEQKSKSSINMEQKYFYLFGEKINFKIDEIKNKIMFLEKEFMLKNKSPYNFISEYRNKELKVYLLIAQLKFEKLMNIEHHFVYVRNKTTAWATNHIAKFKIYYSSNLSSYSKEIIDYVIIHELAHNKFANHSKEFWNYVNKYDSNYKTKKLKLKNKQYS